MQHRPSLFMMPTYGSRTSRTYATRSDSTEDRVGDQWVTIPQLKCSAYRASWPISNLYIVFCRFKFNAVLKALCTVCSFHDDTLTADRGVYAGLFHGAVHGSSDRSTGDRNTSVSTRRQSDYNYQGEYGFKICSSLTLICEHTAAAYVVSGPRGGVAA